MTQVGMHGIVAGDPTVTVITFDGQPYEHLNY